MPLSDYLADGDASPTERERPAEIPFGRSMKLHFIDVGQGAAQLLEFPCGAVLIDTGGEENEKFRSTDALIAYLDQFFARRADLKNTLDLLVVTHPHIDHTRGISAVLERYRVLNVVDNGDVREEVGGFEQIAMHGWIARHRRVGHLDVSLEDIGDEGASGPIIDPVGACPASNIDPVIRVLWGPKLGGEEVGHNPNDDSVVLRVDFGESSALFPGDVEKLSIARLTGKYESREDLLDVDIYQVPHHGSRNSTAQHLIESASPKVAVISMGPYERHLGTEEEYTAHQFGHPNAISIGHLSDEKRGVRGRREKPIEAWVGIRGAWKERPSQFEKRTIERAIYATGWDGTVVVTATANGYVEVNTER